MAVKQLSKKLLKSKEDVIDLEARFLDGERLTSEQILVQYFESKNYLEGLQDKVTVKNYINTLKNRFSVAHNGLWFGCINELGQFGIPETYDEFRYCIERYRIRVIGQVKRATQVFSNGVDKKILSTNDPERLLLPHLKVEEAKK